MTEVRLPFIETIFAHQMEPSALGHRRLENGT